MRASGTWILDGSLPYRFDEQRLLVVGCALRKKPRRVPGPPCHVGAQTKTDRRTIGCNCYA